MSIVIALACTFVIVIATRLLAGYRLPGLAVVALYLVLYVAVARIRRSGTTHERYAKEPRPDHSHWPTSGPIGRLGQPGLIAVWTLTSLLAVLNPFQLAQIVRQAVGNARLQGPRATHRRGRQRAPHHRGLLATLPRRVAGLQRRPHAA
ncbi:hypothetical protein GF314_13870 [bacterium]|nr:hypothetical protein [bacterium]